MRFVPPRRRPQSPISFLSLTSWARPTSLATTSASLQKPFTTKAGLDTAIANATGGEYIYYAGTSGTPLTISSSSGNAYTIANKNPSTPISIDFGCSHNIWDASKITSNYVNFNCTSTSSFHGLYVHDCSNLRIYGGDMQSSGGSGYVVTGGTDSCYFWDFYSHDLHKQGFFALTDVAGGGTSKNVTNNNVRGECTAWGGNISSPSWDPHNEKGTGIHGAMLADVTNGGALTGNTFAFYVHNCPCGNGVELGQQGGGPVTGNVLYIRAEHLSKVATSQTAANALIMWGTDQLSNTTVGWVEGTDLQGAVIWSGDYLAATPIGVTVNHGRHTNVNQNTNGTSGTVPYDSSHGIVLNDCT